MSHRSPKSERIGFITVTAVMMATLLYGVIATRPSLAFVLVWGLMGVAYGALVLRAVRRASMRAWFLVGMGGGIPAPMAPFVRQVFFRGGPDFPWSLLAVELGALGLGAFLFMTAPWMSKDAKTAIRYLNSYLSGRGHFAETHRLTRKVWNRFKRMCAR